MPATKWTGSGTVTIDNHTLEYRCYGPPPSDKLTLVLLHEGLGCAALWKDFPDKLTQATNCGVLSYSRAGYGQSDPCTLPRPPDYMHREATNVLPKVLDSAGIQRCILIGHSDGASIAAIYSGSAQDFRVRAQVLTNYRVITNMSIVHSTVGTMSGCRMNSGIGTSLTTSIIFAYRCWVYKVATINTARLHICRKLSHVAMLRSNNFCSTTVNTHRIYNRQIKH